MKQKTAQICCLALVCLEMTHAQETPLPKNPPARLSVSSRSITKPHASPFEVPLPAHALPPQPEPRPSFAVSSSRGIFAAPSPAVEGTAQYLLPENKKSIPLTPELANLNLPVDTTLITKDTGETVLLPAGTYRQIMTFPINSPLADQVIDTRERQTPAHAAEKSRSRYAPAPEDPIWVRYESLEKIKMDGVERRGGLDIPSHGPDGLEPRVWYAKSEATDPGSALFYFLFGGLGYGVANAASWSIGNVREVGNTFEYRLIRR